MTDITVDVPEAASYLEDEFPDEVSYLQARAVAKERRQIMQLLHERIDALPVWDRRAVPGGKHVLRRLVHQEIDAISTRKYDDE